MPFPIKAKVGTWKISRQPIQMGTFLWSLDALGKARYIEIRNRKGDDNTTLQLRCRKPKEPRRNLQDPAIRFSLVAATSTYLCIDSAYQNICAAIE